MNNSLRVAVDATSLDKGGGLTIGARLWDEITKKYNVDLHIFYSKKIVAEVISKNEIKCKLHPVLLERSSLTRFFIGRLFLLAIKVKQISPQIVWGTNFIIYSLSGIPQVVHQRNLKHFLNDKPFLLRTVKGDLYGATRDLLCRKAVCKATANIYISKYLKEKSAPYQKGNGLNHHVVYNPIVLNNEQLQKEKTFLPDRPYLLSVSSVSGHKDNPTLFRAFAQLVDKRKDMEWKLLVAGAGNWLIFDSFLKDLNISNQVVFLGYCDYQELITLYKSAFCLISTSKLEAFGNAPIEAMAYGCPVIATNSSAMPEIIGDAGCLVDPGDAGAFSDAVLKLWKDKKFRTNLVNRGFKRAQSYTLEESAKNIFKILKKYSMA